MSLTEESVNVVDQKSLVARGCWLVYVIVSPHTLSHYHYGSQRTIWSLLTGNCSLALVCLLVEKGVKWVILCQPAGGEGDVNKAVRKPDPYVAKLIGE